MRSHPSARRLRPTLADWIDFVAQERRDGGMSQGERRRRDRALGADLPARAGRTAKLVAWVRGCRARAREDAVAEPLPGVAVAATVRHAVRGLALAGAGLGAAAAAGALSFQPHGRINVVAVLGVLVGIPGVFLALAVLAALPARARRWLPFVGRGGPGEGWLQPARLALRALPQRIRDGLEIAFGTGRSWERAGGRVRHWLLLSTSQAAGAAFHAGALAATLALVVFTDLSFGWSSTLEIDVRTFHALTDAVSAPWAPLWPEARPSRELVETTRYFRIAGAPDPEVPLARFGAWWPFVVMAIAVYGLLPRLALCAGARLALGRALARAIAEAPASGRVLDRLESPLLETGAEDAEAPGAGGPVPGVASGAEEARGVPLPSRAVVVSWADALGGVDLAAFGCEPVAVVAAGGGLDPERDEGAIAVAARAEEAVVVAVRGFEPPLGELLDFLGDLRRTLPPKRRIVVTPVGGGGRPLAAWHRFVARIGDPWLERGERVPVEPPGAAAPSGAGALRSSPSAAS